MIAEVAEAQTKLAELTRTDIQYTEDIAGTKDKSRKGLRRQVEDEKIKLAEIFREHERVKPLLINAAVDSQLILQRQDQLKDRVKELQPKANTPP